MRRFLWNLRPPKRKWFRNGSSTTIIRHYRGAKHAHHYRGAKRGHVEEEGGGLEARRVQGDIKA